MNTNKIMFIMMFHLYTGLAQVNSSFQSFLKDFKVVGNITDFTLNHSSRIQYGKDGSLLMMENELRERFSNPNKKQSHFIQGDYVPEYLFAKNNIYMLTYYNSTLDENGALEYVRWFKIIDKKAFSIDSMIVSRLFTSENIIFFSNTSFSNSEIKVNYYADQIYDYKEDLNSTLGFKFKRSHEIDSIIYFFSQESKLIKSSDRKFVHNMNCIRSMKFYVKVFKEENIGDAQMIIDTSSNVFSSLFSSSVDPNRKTSSFKIEILHNNDNTNSIWLAKSFVVKRNYVVLDFKRGENQSYQMAIKNSENGKNEIVSGYFDESDLYVNKSSNKSIPKTKVQEYLKSLP